MFSDFSTDIPKAEKIIKVAIQPPSITKNSQPLTEVPKTIDKTKPATIPIHKTTLLIFVNLNSMIAHFFGKVNAILTILSNYYIMLFLLI